MLFKLLSFNKIKKKIKGTGNQVTISNKHCCGKIKIVGNRNKIEINETTHCLDLNITIYGNDNHIFIKDYCKLYSICLNIGIKDAPTANAIIEIKQNVDVSGKTTLFCAEDNSKIIINENCLLSSGIDIWCTDTHSICDNDGNTLNIGKEVIIGKHVWIGKDVKIGKNTKIADNCVVGWGSIVTSSVSGKHKPNSVLAGNPAKVVKENVIWSKERPNIK